MQPVLWVYNTNLTKFSISVYLNYMYVHSLAGTFATLFGNTALRRFAGSKASFSWLLGL